MTETDAQTNKLRLRAYPTPIVDWQTVVLLSDPLREPTRAKLRRLRQQGISKGVLVRPRASDRNAGSNVYYSALTALSAQMAKSGHDEAARELGEAGADLEEAFSAELRDFLAHRSADELPDAPFYVDLVTRTMQAMRHLRLDLFWSTGHVTEISGDLALIASEREGHVVLVEVARSMLASSDTEVGDPVWISRRFVGPSAVTTVLPAVEDPSGSESDPDELSDQEYDAALADEFAESTGKPAEREHVERLRAGAGDRPTHRVSLVG